MKYAVSARIGSLTAATALSACLGISDVDGTDASTTGGKGGVGVDGGGFPGFGGSGADDGGPGDGSAASGGTTGGSGGITGGSGGITGGSGGATGGSGGATGGTLTLKPGLALAGDGFLAQPSLCGDKVIDSYAQSSYKAIHVGRDVPCGGLATYRAFIRFDLSPVKTPLSKATLRFYYASQADPTASVTLYGIPDFVQLTSQSWALTLGSNHGSVLKPTSALGWIERDVSADAKAAQSQGAGVAFELRYDNEGENPAGNSRWYGVVATENGSLGPELVVSY